MEKISTKQTLTSKESNRKETVNSLLKAKKGKAKIAMLTAYDFPFAAILDEAGVEIILIGDSLGNVGLGYRNTLPVTMTEMVIHTQAVARAVKRALVVTDLPFGSFQKTPAEAVANAIELVKAGAEAVKIEGAEYIEAISQIIRAGIPVMGHVGLTPQAVNQLGYRQQGRDKKAAQKILIDAKHLEQVGCFAIVLEMIPDGLAKKITKTLKVPTIGIGAGPDCDGQVLVTHDLLGLSGWRPSFVRPKADFKSLAGKAVKAFIEEVKS